MKVHVNVLPKPLKLSLEMVTPARTPIVQMVPIVNQGEKDWRCKVVLSTDRTEFAVKIDKVNKEVVCKRGTEFQIPLAFSPMWVGKA